MLTKKFTNILIGMIIILFMSIAGVLISVTGTTAHAAETETTDHCNYTIVTDSNGEQGYSVAIKPAAKPSTEVVVIPDTYNGLPVIEIANNGFMSCTNLKKVVMPTSLRKIGNNAFMNCAKLDRVMLPCVESIGMNAFAMCPQLDKAFIPSTVKSVGANIFRNNSNTVYVQSSAEEVNLNWQSTWNSYFTGTVVFSAEAADTIGYREIFDSNKANVIGYEVSDFQSLGDRNADIVIYDSFRPDENSQYLPVLNICSEAFTFSYAHSITIKRRTSPAFTHPINIRSNAFHSFFGDEVSIEVDVTFDQPANFVYPEKSICTGNSALDNTPIIGDLNNNSTKIFEESEISFLTLPSNITFIPERMCYNCSYLKNIRFIGQDDSEAVTFPSSIKKIGKEAFSSCGQIKKLTIPNSVLEVGESAFSEWGTAGNVQTIEVNFYEGHRPVEWSENWYSGAPTLTYKALKQITIDWNDDKGTTQDIGVISGEYMPKDINVPEREGYIFKGIFDSKDNTDGFQYYTANKEVGHIWSEGETTTIYAHWTKAAYKIIYPEELIEYIGTNPTSYTSQESVTILPIDYDGYTYTFIPSKIEKGSEGNVTLKYSRSPKEYGIEYIVDWKGNKNTNPETYNRLQKVVFNNLECEGYTFRWEPAELPVGTQEDQKVYGIWTPKTYKIIYNVTSDTQHDNTDSYTYGQEKVFTPAYRGGYFVSWDKVKIAADTIGDVTVTAIYTEKTLDQCYNNGVYEIWTRTQLESLVNQPNGGSGRKYSLKNNIVVSSYISVYWTQIAEFKGTLDGEGNRITGYELKVSTSGNYGFCKINSGIIENLTLGFRYSVGSEVSDVYIGSFAGTNKGTISNCGIVSSFNRPYFVSYAQGDSYMGCFVGVNESTIEQCNGGDWLKGSCNMGTIAGKNSGAIRYCSAGNNIMEIRYEYRDYNACIGGIVGIQTDGYVTNWSYQGEIYWSSSYTSSKYS
ncbi:MAG: leucine-rich repeat domain-containing protein, partial [Roseburia sp.]|nr:leucine-rich repeat domain-containing protein [Roseburia sp.]